MNRFAYCGPRECKGGIGDEEGKKYTGQWRVINKKHMMDGLGILTFPDGSKYIGQFFEDKM